MRRLTSSPVEHDRPESTAGDWRSRAHAAGRVVAQARIERLLEEQHRQAELIRQLRNEIAVLKGEKARLKFKPSGMEQQTEPETSEGDADGDTGAGDGTGEPRKRPGSAKRPKTAQLTIHETVGVPPGVELPAGSRFKGYRDFVVQDLRIIPHNE